MNEEEHTDLKKIKALREYYRRNFANGESDECFMLWIEQGLARLSEDEQKEGDE